MKNHLFKIFIGMFCLITTTVSSFAQGVDTSHYNFGIWQYGSDALSKVTFPEIRGRIEIYYWKDIEPSSNVWNWTFFDSCLASKTKDQLPVIFKVYTKDYAPDWLYTNGVPKVSEKDNAGNITGYSPYYADPTYKMYFKRMVTNVRQHVETLPDSIRRYIIGVQGCYGSTGDYISYKGTVDPQYRITVNGFFDLFKEFSMHYYNEYKNVTPKIRLVSNPSSKGQEQVTWLLANCPGGWLKQGNLGKGYQLNDEKSKYTWLAPILNLPQQGEYMRSRCEIVSDAVLAGWWTKFPYKNLFTVFCYGLHWGLDWSNQGNDQIFNPKYDPALAFFNKYAGQKDPSKATNAMIALKDVLDAADSVRFPAATYGNVTRSNQNRYQKIVNAYQSYGAKLEDVASAVSTEDINIHATGTNDVGWDLIASNYERYIHQITPNVTSAGYWNISSADTATIYGRFGRGFDLGKSKDRLYFDVDSSFLNYAPLNSQYPVIFEVTYLDSGYGSWQLYYDAQDSTDRLAASVTNNNSRLWKKIAVTVNDPYFGNRALGGSDFYIKNNGSENVIFSLIELTRSSGNLSNVGLFTSPVSTFDDVCIKDSSTARLFTLTGAFLDGSDVVVGPLSGYSFSLSSNGPYSDSLIISNYGASVNYTIYVKLSAQEPGLYSGVVPIYGGGYFTSVELSGMVVNSSPQLTANVQGITCYNAKNAGLDLVLNGGQGPFTYSWTTSTTNFKSSEQDIYSLSPADYTVVVSSYAGCKTSATYSISQPDPLDASVSADQMICKNTVTNAYVTATGGTLPYTGTGTYIVSAGYQSYIVTDANGCTDATGISVANGTLVAPLKPGSISSADADAAGLCSGGDFAYSISPVATATSYTWSLPGGCNISAANADTTGITLSAPAGFISGSLSVTANNVCGSSVASIKTINGAPGTPGAITGITSILPSQTGLTYSVAPVPGVSYTWTVPFGATILSGQNTSSINVKWGTASGNVNVKASNNCGTSLSSLLYVAVIGGTYVLSDPYLPQFDTVCVNGISPYKSFTFSASGLSGEDVVVGPISGFKFSAATNGVYTDSLIYSNYGTTLNRTVYAKFAPSAEAMYDVVIPISGGGGSPAGIGVSGFAVNSKPSLSGAVNNVSCFGSRNGSIDLTLNGGTGPFVYNWTGGGITATYDPASEDINSLAPSTYNVTVTSYAGCTSSASYTISQPDILSVSLSYDSMYCKNSTTTVYVNATGGTLPYSGTGPKTGIAFGTSNFSVTDANGCLASRSIFVANGYNTAPPKPGLITGADADAAGICGGGNFNFSIDPVATATSYTWSGPAGSGIAPANSDGTQIAMTIPSGITSDSVRVTASNVCGTGVASVKLLSSIPGKPGAITGPSAVLPSQAGTVYSVPAVPGVVYKWTVPTGATIVAGSNTSAITVNWGSKTGNVTVKAQNNCGISLASSLGVTVSSAVFVPSVTSLPLFDTTCVAGLSANKSFTFSASGLTGTAVVVGPVAGFKFSATSAGPYSDSLIYTSYGTSFTNQPVFVKFNPATAGLNSGNVGIKGGGAPAIVSIAVSGNAVLTSPSLSANISNITCSGLKNGAIDLSIAGGVGPFTYSWTGTGTYDPTKQDITGLSAVSYKVTVTSYAGCTTSSTYTVSQPNPVTVTPVANTMLCKNGTTTVNVSATGGTMPYSGTGTFTGVSAGTSSYTVTDANGCTGTKAISVVNGTGLPPSKPVIINGPASDASGICGGGTFTFSIDAVSNANNYSWIAPSRSSILNTSTDGTQATISIPSGLTTDSVRVAALNTCGSSANTAKVLTAAPGKVPAITGPVSVLPSQVGLVYTVASVPGLSYTWTVPAGSTITSGVNTASITVKWGTKAGNVTVKAVNTCGSSLATPLAVSVANAILVPSVTSLPVFDTACVAALSTAKSFTFSASGLNGSNVVVGPLAGFKFATASAGPYGDSLVFSSYGTSFTNQPVYVKFNPSTAKAYSGNVIIKGGGGTSGSVALSAVAVNSSPVLSAAITNVTCAGLANGAIDLSITGGTGPFTYGWTGGGVGTTYNPSAQDIAGLKATSYNVTVGSYAGCTTTATYTVNQPAVVAVSVSSDAMVCKNSTTSVYVSATGGTVPYSGTGTFTVSAGIYSYTVTDANGCTGSKSITVANGTGVAPTRPVAINSAAADAAGVCGTGNFSYAIDPVANATSYIWTLPSGTTLASGAGTTSIQLIAQAGFSSGTLTVSANNTCGTSLALSKALSSLPAKPGAVTGSAAVSPGQTGLVYSVPAVAGLTYNWTVPAGSAIVSGQGTSSITVNWGNSSGLVKAFAVNSCGTSVVSSLSVAVGAKLTSFASVEKTENVQTAGIAVYPNPAKDLAYVKFDAGKEYRYAIDITDITGKPVIRKNGIAMKGINTVSVDVHGLSNGTYIVAIFNEKGERKTWKLVKE